MKERIFLSSVQKELASERRALKDYVHGDPLLSRFFELFLFEDVPAADRRADDLYLGEVDRCAVYVGLLGNEYGREDPEGFSATEREFDRASAQGKIRLIFVKGTDDAKRQPKMQALLRKAGDQLIRRRFSGTPDLTAGLYASLIEHLAQAGKLRVGPFDAVACEHATLGDLSKDKVRQFLRTARQERQFALEENTPLKKALAHLNLLDRALPSHAAMLLFGREPQRFLPTSLVKCLHFHGTEIQKPIPSYQAFKGTVFELVDQAVDFVLAKIDRTVGTRSEGPQAPVTYELPPQAVSEAIVNAVAHRDYASNASVQVMLFADRLEVWNPGGLPPSLSFQSLREPHPSIPHNPLIAEPLFLTRYIERAGTGTLDMARLCAAASLPAPEFREAHGQFIQTLWRPKKAVVRQATQEVTQEVAQEVAKLLPLCRDESTRKDLQRALSLRDDEHFRAAYLLPAIASGLLEMTVPDKPTSRLQKYRLTDKGHAWLAGRKGSRRAPTQTPVKKVNLKETKGIRRTRAGLMSKSIGGTRRPRRRTRGQ